MKAQFAPLEIAISGFLVFSVLSYTYASAGRSAANAYAAKEELLGNVAAYDFINQMIRDSGLHSCIAAYLDNGSDCMYGYLPYYRYVYGINISIYPPYSQAPDSAQRFRCFPFNASDGLRDFCIGA
ncbi:MAG: hypothetical protein KGH69_00930 [Candidatus Micrarchaeota archaeon]|nr:hypothetical protein [Candidatus Micrarchaeota archaeon]